jgi:hypothetical protein
MAKRWSDTITGALTFIRESRPEDEIFVVHFNDAAQLALPPDRPFSADVMELRPVREGQSAEKSPFNHL